MRISHTWNTSCVRWLFPLSWTDGASALAAGGPSWCHAGHRSLGAAGDISAPEGHALQGPEHPHPDRRAAEVTPPPPEHCAGLPAQGRGAGCPGAQQASACPSFWCLGRAGDGPGSSSRRAVRGAQFLRFQACPAAESPGTRRCLLNASFGRQPLSRGRSFAPGLGGAAGWALATGLGVTVRRARSQASGLSVQG